jgi:cytochrome c553
MKVTRFRVTATTVASLVVGLTIATEAQADDLYDYGEYLSSECTACHKLGGDGDGIPSIAGWPVDIFVGVMESYRESGRFPGK